MSGTYQRYLASREWAVLREQVRKRSGGRCERCIRAPMEQVHHVTYERVQRERLDDLRAVCRPCHEYLSAKRDEDPAWTACTIFVAGPVTTAWHACAEDIAGNLAHLALPIGSDKRFGHMAPVFHIGGSRVFEENRIAMRQCCGMIAWLDRIDRTGTICDTLAWSSLSDRPTELVLITGVPGGSGLLCQHAGACDCRPLDGVEYGDDPRGGKGYTFDVPDPWHDTRRISPAWYLLSALDMDGATILEGDPLHDEACLRRARTEVKNMVLRCEKSHARQRHTWYGLSQTTLLRRRHLESAGFPGFE